MLSSLKSCFVRLTLCEYGDDMAAEKPRDLGSVTDQGDKDAIVANEVK